MYMKPLSWTDETPVNDAFSTAGNGPKTTAPLRFFEGIAEKTAPVIGFSVAVVSMVVSLRALVGTDPAGLAHSLEVSSRVVDKPVILVKVCRLLPGD